MMTIDYTDCDFASTAVQKRPAGGSQNLSSAARGYGKSHCGMCMQGCKGAHTS